MPKAVDAVGEARMGGEPAQPARLAVAGEGLQQAGEVVGGAPAGDFVSNMTTRTNRVANEWVSDAGVVDHAVAASTLRGRKANSGAFQIVGQAAADRGQSC
jgi:hypothetical protein